MDIHPERPNNSIESPMLNNEVSKLGVVVRNFLGQHAMQNYGSDSTLQLFLTKMQQLETAWAYNEKKYTLLEVENEQLKLQLLNETNKCDVLQKKLQFIQENKGHFEKLKEVYSKMKQMELEKNRSRINIHKATQSESVMSTSSYATCMLQSEVNEIQLKRTSSSTISVRKVELAKAQVTIDVLKQLIYRREQTWGLNSDKQKHYAQNVKRLEKENASLRSIVRSHYNQSKEHIGTSMEDVKRHTRTVSVEVNSVQPTETTSTNTMDNTLIVMQGIVKKLEDRNTELEKMIKGRSSDTSSDISNVNKPLIQNKIHNNEEYLKNIPSQKYSTIILPNEDSIEPVRTPKKYPSKSASSPVQRNRPRSLPPSSLARATGSVSASQQYAPHPRCSDHRCHEPNYSTITAAHPPSKRIEKQQQQLRSGKIEVHVPLARPAVREATELEILKEIKDEILKKQQNINKKLEVFEYGLDKREIKMKSALNI